MDENQNFNDGLKRKFFKLIFVLVAIFVLSFAVLFLWNAILPQTTHVGTINYWQALALLALCRLLFGNFNFGPPWGGPPKPRKDENRFINSSEEDEAVFKEEWKKRREKWGR